MKKLGTTARPELKSHIHRAWIRVMLFPCQATGARSTGCSTTQTSHRISLGRCWVSVTNPYGGTLNMVLHPIHQAMSICGKISLQAAYASLVPSGLTQYTHVRVFWKFYLWMRKVICYCLSVPSWQTTILPLIKPIGALVVVRLLSLLGANLRLGHLPYKNCCCC